METKEPNRNHDGWYVSERSQRRAGGIGTLLGLMVFACLGGAAAGVFIVLRFLGGLDADAFRFGLTSAIIVGAVAGAILGALATWAMWLEVAEGGTP